MAEKLPHFDFNLRRKSKLGDSPLDKYLDGQIWRLTMKDARELEEAQNFKDVYRNLQNLRIAFYQRARRLGFNTRARTDEEHLVIQSYGKEKGNNGTNS